MTKKDYKLLAGVLAYYKDQEDNCCYNLHATIVEALADALKEDNPKFDKELFLIACGVA